MTALAEPSPEIGASVMARVGESLQTVFESELFAAIIADSQGVLIAVNEAFGKFLGYRPAELIGKNIRHVTHPDDVAKSNDGIQLLQEQEGTKVLWQSEKRYLHRDGRILWARVSAARLRDASDSSMISVGHVEDITQQRESERKLRISEMMFRRSFEASPIPKALLGSSGEVMAANHAMLELTGASGACDITWSALFGGIGSDDAMHVRRLLSPIGDGETREFQFRLRRRGAPPVVLHTVVSSLDGDANLPRLIVQMVDVTARQAMLETAMQRAMQDELTGLSNRTDFEEKLKRTIGDRRQQRRHLAVFMIDVNGFKAINDGLGHAAGDEALVQIARRIEAACRHADTVARIGGDEFWVLAYNINNETDAIGIATSIRRSVSEPIQVGETSVCVGVSIGIVTAPNGDYDGAELMRKADVAQYRAKEMQCGWAFYDERIDAQVVDRLELAASLRSAIATTGLHVFYQPMYDTAAHLVGFEALARWQHPTRGPVSPDVFIPLAERTHLIEALTRSILHQSASQCASWRSAGFAVNLSVNLAAGLLENDGLAQMVSDELDRSGLPSSALTFEVTEGRIADGGNPVVRKTLATLHDMGIRLSIDDFGTGYSAMSYLKDLPFDEMKIDKSFILRLDTNDRDVAIVSALLGLAKALSLEVAAEGVESDTTAEILRVLGCNILQGFALGRPMAAVEATRLLTRLWGSTQGDRQSPAVEIGALTRSCELIARD